MPRRHDHTDTDNQESETPFEKVDRFSKRQAGLGIYRVCMALGVATILYLNTLYVKRSEFESVKADVGTIKTTLLIMAAQDKQLQDHEQRLRELERDRQYRNSKP